jgi:hypothetical protein
MGRIAVRRALDQMERGDRHVYATTVVRHTLLIRASCGAGMAAGEQRRMERSTP